DLGQAKSRLRVIGRDAVVAGEREFEPTTHGGPIERADPWFARCFKTPVELRQLSTLLENESSSRLLALCTDEIGEYRAHALEHREIGTAAERVLAGSDDCSLDGAVGGHPIHQRAQFLDHARRDDVH